MVVAMGYSRQGVADELKLVQFVDGKSTTNTIKRIQENEKCNN
jgi:D-beta-D-heptose 7-phosphate kinase/D-beta-D-heptose 1-phosphate adenosyltransferase